MRGSTKILVEVRHCVVKGAICAVAGYRRPSQACGCDSEDTSAGSVVQRTFCGPLWTVDCSS